MLRKDMSVTKEVAWQKCIGKIAMPDWMVLMS